MEEAVDVKDKINQRDCFTQQNGEVIQLLCERMNIQKELKCTHDRCEGLQKEMETIKQLLNKQKNEKGKITSISITKYNGIKKVFTESNIYHKISPITKSSS